jgi:hypothetical protein
LFSKKIQENKKIFFNEFQKITNPDGKQKKQLYLLIHLIKFIKLQLITNSIDHDTLTSQLAILEYIIVQDEYHNRFELFFQNNDNLDLFEDLLVKLNIELQYLANLEYAKRIEKDAFKDYVHQIVFNLFAILLYFHFFFNEYYLKMVTFLHSFRQNPKTFLRQSTFYIENKLKWLLLILISFLILTQMSGKFTKTNNDQIIIVKSEIHWFYTCLDKIINLFL